MQYFFENPCYISRIITFSWVIGAFESLCQTVTAPSTRSYKHNNVSLTRINDHLASVLRDNCLRPDPPYLRLHHHVDIGRLLFTVQRLKELRRIFSHNNCAIPLVNCIADFNLTHLFPRYPTAGGKSLAIHTARRRGAHTPRPIPRGTPKRNT